MLTEKEMDAANNKMPKKPLAVTVRIYQGDIFPMADITTSPCDGSTTETIIWSNQAARDRFSYDGYTLFYDERINNVKKN